MRAVERHMVGKHTVPQKFEIRPLGFEPRVKTADGAFCSFSQDGDCQIIQSGRQQNLASCGDKPILQRATAVLVCRTNPRNGAVSLEKRGVHNLIPVVRRLSNRAKDRHPSQQEQEFAFSLALLVPWQKALRKPEGGQMFGP